MGIINVNLNVSLVGIDQIEQMREGFDKRLDRAIKTAGHTIASMMFDHTRERAEALLHSTRDLYIQNLSRVDEDDNTYLIVLKGNVRWIDDGMKPHSMVEDLLSGKNAKMGKNGRYAVVPFVHGPGKGPASATPAQQSLTQTLQKAMAKRQNPLTGKKGIPWNSIENGQDGKPLTGLLHSFDINDKPVRSPQSGMQPFRGQGHGAIGSVMQGPTGIPFLRGVRVYQSEVKTPAGNGSVKRSIVTFRTVTESMKGTNRWFHPGNPGVHIFEETAEWGVQQWEKVILPKLLEYVIG
ncbi:hypothetical protein UFOVP75_68 [uncultured Caudovirales phage]|uniref:Uncharacterized protein n=1 Tax=uncultured Caudovirales phage TaxID=2100421 RepID=A0A6J5L1K2_9CAUD|nr:hypothetical protein UFOVP75_68 [uncultured Caudovirales phage]